MKVLNQIRSKVGIVEILKPIAFAPASTSSSMYVLYQIRSELTSVSIECSRSKPWMWCEQSIAVIVHPSVLVPVE